MSYILEALKKSQQERELGQVPTLVATPVSDARRLARGNPWGLVAVALAALAVIIALYAALNRVEVQPVAPQPEPAAGAAPDAPAAVAGAGAPVTPDAPPGPGLDGSARTAQAPTKGPVAGLAPLPEAGYQAARPDPRRTDDLGVGPRTLAEPATPGDATTGLAENASGQDAMDEPISDDWMEMDEELGPAQPAELSPADETAAPRHRRTKPARAALPDPAVPSIPEDLRRDVAAFKDEIRRERSGAAPRPAAAKATREDPKKLRLPLEVEGRLPAFFVTAHIYDTDSSKRFVVLNSLKYTEGETTREGLKVEDILPDGVVLGFEGHRFFRRR